MLLGPSVNPFMVLGCCSPRPHPAPQGGRGSAPAEGLLPSPRGCTCKRGPGVAGPGGKHMAGPLQRWRMVWAASGS